jgi:hypothetical protein
VAAKGGTITYGELGRKLGLDPLREVGLFSGIVSEYCISKGVPSDVFLSSIVVTAESRNNRLTPMGIPSSGAVEWWSRAPPGEPERSQWAFAEQAKVWKYCSHHRFGATRWFPEYWAKWIGLAATAAALLTIIATYLIWVR